MESHPIKTPPDGNFDGTLVHKVYEFYTELYKFVKVFPKKDRFAIGIKLETQTLEILELILLAKRKVGTSQMLLLHKIDLKLKILKLLVRTSYEVRALTQPKYMNLEKRLIEIGKMLGGWLKQKNTKGP